jgi:hypothetical protein
VHDRALRLYADDAPPRRNGNRRRAGSEREQCVIVTAVAGSDTARLWRVGEFRSESHPPDTLQVTITLGRTRTWA